MTERDQEQGEPDGAELGKRLEIQVVRVARVVRRGPLLQPAPLEAAGPLAQQRLALDHRAATRQ